MSSLSPSHVVEAPPSVAEAARMAAHERTREIIRLRLINVTSGLLTWLSPAITDDVLAFLSLGEVYAVVALTSTSLHAATQRASTKRDTLSLSDFEELLDDAALSTLASRFGAAVRTVDVSHCELLTDDGLRALARACPNLRSLALVSCNGVSPAGLCAVAERCPLLEHADLYGLNAVDDAALEAIARGCALLVSVDATDCPVSDASVAVLLAKGRYLEALTLTSVRAHVCFFCSLARAFFLVVASPKHPLPSPRRLLLSSLTLHSH
jgi:hypothetical protein